MPNTIQPINPSQNVQMVNSHQDKTPQPRPAEKPPERPEPAIQDRPERAEVHNAPPLKKAETNHVEENQAREKPADENPKPQNAENNQEDKQLGKTLDIMA